jgi:molybdenum cofactor guanylyltransferase
MLGIVLCGGQSLRMGTDKGLLTAETKTWAQSACNKLSALHFPVKISVNQQQRKSYLALFAENDLITDDTSLQLKGPLLGVLSGHIQFPSEDLMILACDMPLMETSIIKLLYSNYQEHPSADAFIFTNEGEPEPLCAIYSSNALSRILSMFRNGDLLKYSMKFMLDHLVINSIPVMEEQKKYFQNFNAHAELNGQ